jgi:hypothetical protein
MAWTIADGLGWLPSLPIQVPHRRTKIVGGVSAPVLPTPAPVVIPPGLLAFAPTYPGQVPHHRVQTVLSGAFGSPLPPAIWPLAWLPIYPGQVPHRRLSALYHPERFEPPPSVQVLIAQQMAWLAQYPSTVPHRRTPIQGGSFAAIDPVVAAAGILCVELRDGDLTSPALVSEALTTTGFINEALTSPGLINEGLC